MTDKNIQEADVGSGTKVADTKQSEKRAQLTLKSIQLRLKQEKERAALQQQKKSLRVKEDVEVVEESFSPSQIAALKAEYSKINTVDPDSDTYKKLIAMLDRLDLKSLKSLAGAEIKFVSKLAQNRVARKSMKKEEVHEANIQPTSAKSRTHISNLSHPVTNSVTHPSSGKEIGIITKQSDGKYYAHTSSVKLSHSQGKVFDTKDQAHQYIRDAHAKAIKTGTLSDRWKKQEKLPQFAKEEVQLDELSTNKLADYKKKASDSASAADKAGDTKTGNKRFSGIMKATRKQFDNDAKKTNEDVTEASQRVDSLVTDALKIMKGSELKDAVQALKTVLGDREYNDRRGHYNFYVKQLVDMYGKKTNEELSPKQKAIDKNKNGKIDGFDLAHLRKKTEELSPAQKAIDKNKNGKIDGTDLAHLRNKKKPQGADFAAQRRKERLASNGRMDEESINEKSDYEVYHKDYSSAVQTAIKQAEKRGYEVDMDDWHDKVATGPKKPSSGKTNSFSINLMKDGKASKKKLQMQVYNMDNQKYELNMYIEEFQLEESHGEVVWKKGNQSIEKLDDGQFSVYMADGKKKMFPSLDAAKKYVNEASSPAQQAAIAIAMKKADKKPKDMEESDAYDKDVKPSDKPHDKDAAAKRAKLAALAARKKMSEGLMDKIKAMKRGMQAKDKADDHWDKAGDPKNPHAKKDLKKAVRYTNLLNKEGTGPDLNPVTKHVTKGSMTKSGISKWLAVSEEEKVPEFKSGGPELAKKFNKSFKALGVDAKVKIKTVGNVSVNEEEITEAKKKSWKDMRKKTKNEETPNKSTVKKGDMLTGKKEPIEINPELKEPAK